MNKIAVLDHPKRPETQRVANDIVSFIKAAGIETLRGTTWETDALTALIPGVDLVIALGGDGSILRAARIAAPNGVPITSVSMGHLGFLAEMEPHNWRESISRIIAGDYWIEDRMMLTATTRRGNLVIAQQEALNDVVVGRGSLARVVRIRTSVDGSMLTTYAGDGLIVSTATGSTAYSLAAGGPILPPTLKNIILVPIAPHMSLDKPVVLWQRSVVEMEVQTDLEAAMTADGQDEVSLRDGDVVTVQVSPNVAQFVRTQPQGYFYRTLMRRLVRPEAMPS